MNEALFVANYTNYTFLQAFYPTRGILAWLDVATREMHALPGADDTGYVHCTPVWTPDGKEIIFSRATARDPYDKDRPLPEYPNDPNEPEIRYDIVRMPFGDGARRHPGPDRGRLRERHEQHVPQGVARRQVARLHEVPQRAADAPGRPPVDRAGRGRRSSRDALQHVAHELLAQLVSEQPVAGLLLQGLLPLHADAAHARR